MERGAGAQRDPAATPIREYVGSAAILFGGIVTGGRVLRTRGGGRNGVFNKQHVRAPGRTPTTGTLTRRSLLLAGACWLALQARSLDGSTADAEPLDVLGALGIGR